MQFVGREPWPELVGLSWVSSYPSCFKRGVYRTQMLLPPVSRHRMGAEGGAEIRAELVF